jgi:hypothetical protein
METIIVNKPYARVVYNPEKKRLYQTWEGFASVDQFKAAIDASVDCFRKHEVDTILSDTTGQAVLAKEGSDYAASVMPELAANGMKKIAFILPKSAFTQLSLQNFTKNSDNNLVGHFENRQEAEAWLDA